MNPSPSDKEKYLSEFTTMRKFREDADISDDDPILLYHWSARDAEQVVREECGFSGRIVETALAMIRDPIHSEWILRVTSEIEDLHLGLVEGDVDEVILELEGVVKELSARSGRKEGEE